MSKNTVAVAPLSGREERRLAELEGQIVQDFASFHRVGKALAEIRDSGLYRITHRDNFEGYCKDLWDLAKSKAYRLINASEIYDNLLISVGSEQTEVEIPPAGGALVQKSPIGPLLPGNERQIRPLTRLRPEQQRQVWQSVVAATPEGKKPTASAINKAVKDYLGEKVKSGIRQARKQGTEKMSDNKQFATAFNVYLTHIIDAQADGYSTISRQAILDTLDAARALLAADGVLMNDSVVCNNRDADKLEKAGYKLLRLDTASMIIEQSAGGTWPKHSGPFESQKALLEAFEALMQYDMNLAG